MRCAFSLTIISALLVILVLIAIQADGAGGPLVGLSAEERTWLDQNRDSIVLTYDAAFPPLEYQNKDGKYAGMAADIITRIEKLLGVTFEKRPSHNWNAVESSLESGETHLNGGMVSTPEREKFAYFLGPYIVLPLAIFTTTHSITGNVTWADLEGKRVAVVSGYASERYVRGLALDRFEVVPVKNVQEGLHDVSFGRVDAFVENLATASYQLDKDALTNLRVGGTTDYVFPISISVSHKYPLLHSALQKALAEIPQEDIEASRKRWISLSGEGLLSPYAIQVLKVVGLFSAALLLSLAGISYLLKRRLNEKVRSLHEAQQELLEQAERKIAERIEHEQELRHWIKRFDIVNSAANHIFYDYDLTLDDITWKGATQEVLGVSVEELNGPLKCCGDRIHPEDAPEALRLLEEARAACSKFVCEYRLRHKDGRYVYMHESGVFLPDEDGKALKMLGILQDVSTRKNAELALKQSEEKFRAIFNNAPIGIFRSLYSGSFTEANPTLARMLGYADREELIRVATDLARDIYPDRATRQRMLDALLASPSGVSMEIEFMRKDGSLFQAIIHTALHYDDEGLPSWLEGTIEDITERKKIEEALRQSEKKFRAIFNNLPLGIFRSSFGGVVLEANPALARMHGYASTEDFLRDNWDLNRKLYARSEDRQRLLDALLTNPSGVHMEIDFLRADGVIFQTIVNAALHLDENGVPSFIDGSIEDITERKMLELHLANQLVFQEALINTIPYAVFYKGPDTRFTGLNKAYEKCFGVRREELIGKRVLDLEYLPNEDRLAYQVEDEAVIASVGMVQKEMPIPFADGVVHQTLYSVTGFRLNDGVPGGLIGIIVDITDFKQAEERLRQSEEKFSRIFEMAPECITFIRLRDEVVIAANAAFETITGYTREESIGRSVLEIGLLENQTIFGEILKQLEADGHVKDFELLLRRKDGELRRVVNSAQLVAIVGEECFVSVIHDITDEHKMQEVLIQSEKMMSLGSLAAGIAHEINNPLGIVHQAVQHLFMRTDPTHEKNKKAAADLGLDMNLLQQYLQNRKVGVYLEDIQAAAQRASSIIRNMLNFSRRSESKRQMCNLPQIVEQSVFLASSDYDLKKSFDFKNIEIVLDVDDNLPRCSCTETEIEQVLLNLLRNASQAMAMADPPTPTPRIDIRLYAVDAGVRIEVADNGPGMSEGLQHKVLEPFFTTKPPGVGTGLGLSVSYFIITKGHEGRMWLSSDPGKGATFFIELPAENPEASHA